MDTKYVNSFNYYDFASLKGLKSESQDSKEEQLKVVASQLESVFLQLVMKNMQDANDAFKSDLFSSDQKDFYQDMLNQQMALSLSKAGGIGLAEMIVKQLQGGIKSSTLPVHSTVEGITTSANISPKPNHDLVAADNAPPLSSNEVKDVPVVNSNVQEFIKTVLPFAKQVAKIIGIDPKLLVAQSALETGWGKHFIRDENQVSANNLFGIKASGNQPKIDALTTEYVDNKPVREVAGFKSYSSMLESFLDYISLLQTKRYEKALANAEDPRAFLTELQNAGYATDPEYANKVLAIYQNHLDV